MIVLAATAWLLSPGCGGNMGPDIQHVSPAATGVEEIIIALRSDDPTPAYTLIADALHEQVDFEEFAAQWRATRAEREERARALEAELTSSRSIGERTRIIYADGKSMYLVREGSAWRVESPLVSRFHASRPHEAARLFARAFADHDYDGVMHMLTSRRRDHLDRHLTAFITSLLAHLAEGVDTLERIDEERAHLRWDHGDMSYRIVLRKEGDEWRVDDVHIHPAPESSGGAFTDTGTE